MIDEGTERLINRRLDGELGESESLELDKLLIRSPQVRALAEEYERNGAAAAEALRAALDDAGSPTDRAERLARTVTARRWPWRAVRRRAAVAAAVLGVIIGAGAVYRLAAPEASVTPEPAGIEVANPVAVNKPAPAGDKTPVEIEHPRRREQRVVRDIFGVFDEETQSVYLLEANRTQTSVVPVSANY